MQLKSRILEGRRFRRVIAQMGRPGQPPVERLYGKGTFVQHFAVDSLSPKALCGGDVLLVSD